MTPRYDTFDTPLGAFTIAVDGQGAVTAAVFGGPDALPASIQREGPTRDAEATASARRQVEEYFAGVRQDFDLPLSPKGSEFQTRFWRDLAAVPFGVTTSYGVMARDLGSSARAIGRANATNPICLILPCHRVIGTDGSLTGYAYGIEIKRALLEHERAVLARASAAA
jgi:methylated-DNA-[protein]-cysteine S-methyltransferase